MLHHTRCTQSSHHLCITVWPHSAPFLLSFLICVFVSIIPSPLSQSPYCQNCRLESLCPALLLPFNCHILRNTCVWKAWHTFSHIFPQFLDGDFKHHQLITSNIVYGSLSGRIQPLFVLIAYSTEHPHCVLSPVLSSWPWAVKSHIWNTRDAGEGVKLACLRMIKLQTKGQMTSFLIPALDTKGEVSMLPCPQNQYHGKEVL